MRMRKAFVTLLALATFAVAAVASAEHEDKVDVVAGKGEIVATAKGNWHINEKYPWKATVGSVVIKGEEKVKLSPTNAKILGVPAGEAEVSVGICSTKDGQCIFTKRKVTVGS